MGIIGPLGIIAFICFVGTFLGIRGENCGEGNNCTCFNFIMDCRSLRYKTFPLQIGTDIEEINLSDNDLRSLSQIPEEAELRTLVLASNQIHKMNYDAFDNLDNLKTLILSDNYIRVIEDDIFEWNPLKLGVLHLDANKLQFIQRFLFYDLEELTELHLQNNEITYIHPHAFLQLKKLRILRLDGNLLHTFNSKWIEHLQGNVFATLRFDNNPWSCDCAMSDSNTWLLKQKKSGWFQDLTTLHPIVCSRPPRFTSHLLSSLTRRELQQTCDIPRINGISSPTILDSGRDMLLRCTCDNTLLPIPSISWVAPDKDVYRLYTASNFDGIEVFGNGNLLIRNVSAIDSGTYVCTATNTKGSFEATTSLTVINTLPRASPPPFVYNVTKTVPTVVVQAKPDYGVFLSNRNCPKECQCESRHIDCAGDGENQLTSIPKDIPSDAITINLANNNLTKVKPSDFAKFKSLEELRLDHNKISEIHPNAFSHLESLMTLTMQENQLKEIVDGTFRYMKRLSVLVLDKNYLTDLKGEIFEGLTGLQWLYVRHNYITSIDEDVFTPLDRIKFIHLESNRITALHSATIEDLIKKRPSTVVKTFVDDNPFQCDCSMEEMRKMVQNHTFPEDFFGDGLLCKSPLDIAGRRLLDIKTELTCDEIVKPKSSAQGISLTAVLCVVFGGVALGVVLAISMMISWRTHGRVDRKADLKKQLLTTSDDLSFTTEIHTISNARPIIFDGRQKIPLRCSDDNKSSTKEESVKGGIIV